MRMVVLGCALVAALLSIPAVADASTKGFDVKNYSAYTLKLVKVEPYGGICAQTNCFEGGRPPTGADMHPGASQRWELYAPYSGITGAWITYDVLEGNQKVGTDMITLGYQYSGGAGMYSGCKQTYSGTSCQADGWSRLSNTLTFYDSPGSTHTIPASEPDAQARVLSGLCGAPKIATHCDFSSLEGPEHGFLPTRVVGDSKANCTDEKETAKFMTADEVGQTNSLEVTTGFTFKADFWVGTATATIEVSYGHKWENKHTFTESFNVPVKPKHIIWVTDSVPVITYKGDYTLKLNDTTIKVPNVAFHTPDTNRTANWTSHEEALTPDQETLMCSGSPAGPLG
jgi:hypothetical protein